MVRLKLKAYKWLFLNIFFVFSLMMAYVIQVSFNFFVFKNLAVLFILPVVVAIAMFEGAFVACWYGFLAGVLCSMAFDVKMVVSCFVLIVFCSLVSWLTTHYFKITIFSFLVFLLVLIITELLMIMFCGHNINNFLSFKVYFYKTMLPSMILTEMVGWPIFLFFKFSIKKFFYNDNIFSIK